MFEIAAELGVTVAAVLEMPVWEFEGWQARIAEKRRAKR